MKRETTAESWARRRADEQDYLLIEAPKSFLAGRLYCRRTSGGAMQDITVNIRGKE